MKCIVFVAQTQVLRRKDPSILGPVAVVVVSAWPWPWPWPWIRPWLRPWLLALEEQVAWELELLCLMRSDSPWRCSAPRQPVDNLNNLNYYHNIAIFNIQWFLITWKYRHSYCFQFRLSFLVQLTRPDGKFHFFYFFYFFFTLFSLSPSRLLLLHCSKKNYSLPSPLQVAKLVTKPPGNIKHPSFPYSLALFSLSPLPLHLTPFFTPHPPFCPLFTMLFYQFL